MTGMGPGLGTAQGLFAALLLTWVKTAWTFPSLLQLEQDKCCSVGTAEFNLDM